MRTVLLIDDDAIVRELLAGYLREHGWRVIEAQDGETGLGLARQHRPAAILSDLMMPRLNGYQLCAAIRGDPALARTRLIAISGRTYPADRESALDAGADEFLLKPVNGSEVLALLNKLVEEAPPELASAPAPARARPQPTRVKFWGVRGSIPTPGPQTVLYGGNTSCVEVRADNEIIILDSGTGIRPLGLALAAEFKGRPLNLTLLISHTHWDHIQGFPFFVPAYDPKNRIRILGYEGARAGLAGVLSSQMEGPFFPIGLDQLPSNIVIEELRDLEFQIGQVKVQAAFMNHPGVCMGYRLFTSQGSVAYLPDNEPCLRLRASAEPGAIRQARSLDFAEAEDRKTIDFIHGADVLILDSQYDADEYASHVGWGHGCVDDVVALALRAEARQLFLFHHDPSHDDARISGMVQHARTLAAERRGALRVDAAQEGEVVELSAGEA